MEKDCNFNAATPLGTNFAITNFGISGNKFYNDLNSAFNSKAAENDCVLNCATSNTGK